MHNLFYVKLKLIAKLFLKKKNGIIYQLRNRDQSIGFTIHISTKLPFVKMSNYLFGLPTTENVQIIVVVHFI